MTRKPLLSIANLSAQVEEKQILHNVSLDVPQGEVHVLMGPNGAGKSTLGHVIMGNPTYEVTQGSIQLADQDITELSTDKRSHAGLFLSFQAPVEIPGVPLSSFLRATIDKREGFAMKNKEFRHTVEALADELSMDRAYLDRELGVGFSGGEKKKVEMLQLLLLKPKLAILDETDSGLDVDALSVVSKGMEAYRQTCDGTLLIITHNTRILEHLDVDQVHVMVQGHLVAQGDASLIDEIDNAGFEQFELPSLTCAHTNSKRRRIWKRNVQKLPISTEACTTFAMTMLVRRNSTALLKMWCAKYQKRKMNRRGC